MISFSLKRDIFFRKKRYLFSEKDLIAARFSLFENGGEVIGKRQEPLRGHFSWNRKEQKKGRPGWGAAFFSFRAKEPYSSCPSGAPEPGLPASSASAAELNCLAASGSGISSFSGATKTSSNFSSDSFLSSSITSSLTGSH